MTRKEFRELTDQKIIILDGATGSNLLKQGMPHGVCTEQWVREHRQVMIDLQREYIEKGSNIIYAPTFSGNRIKLKEYGLLDQIGELNRMLVALSKEAADGRAYVAGDITMTGAQLEPMGDLDFGALVDIYREQISYLAEAGVDLLVIETMMSLQETRAAVLAARAVCELPVMATLSFQENGRTLYGVSAQSAMVVLQGMGVDAVGVNCSAGPDRLAQVIRSMKDFASVPVIAKPNAGMPKLLPDGSTGYDMGTDDFCTHMKMLVEAGAGIIGGCCGTTPEFIGALKRMAERKPVSLVSKQECIYLASERQVYVFIPGQKLTVGQGIDFETAPELLEEYREDVFDSAVDLAFDMEGEADILRIRANTAGTDEKEALLAVAREVCRNVSLPCAIASESLEAIGYVLERFPGIIAVEAGHNLEEWKTKIKSMAKSRLVPVLTIDKEIIYC